MVADARVAMGTKTLSTLAMLDEGALTAAMAELAAEALPGPCLFEVTTWLSEHAFAHVSHRF